MSVIHLKDKEVETICGGTYAISYTLTSKGNEVTVEAGLGTAAAFNTAIGNIPGGNIPGVDIVPNGVVIR
ncbi:TPA: hypothetical protein I8038_000268 [Legionella pneumophila]|nr:hypothetical protein [Legionella pneumophila]